MKMQWKSALSAGMIVASLAGVVNAEEEKGFYIGGNAYYTQVFDADGKVSAEAGSPLSAIPVLGDVLAGLLGGGAAVSQDFETSYDDDIGYGLLLGYKFAGPWRGEFEYREQENDIDSVDVGAGSFSSDDTLEVTSMMGNLWYDFNMEEAVRPYVGFGLGMANVDTGSADDDVMIGQLGAGINWFLTPRLALDLGYRYAMAEDPTFKSGTTKVESEYSSQSLVAGIRYNFFDAQYGVQDEDGDGVPDEADQCLGTPKGVQVDSDGCPLDGDNDGVADYLDQCPNTPAGHKVDEQGCSIDSDGDGVADADDLCPNTPAGEPVMSNGCAEKQSVILRGVNFELNSAQLTVNAETILDGVATTLSESPGFNVELQGHTDSTGSSSYNMNLSQNRAKSVKTYLTDKGVSSGRLTAKGYGEDMPIADNDTREGRAENRRVELKVVGKDEGVMMEEEVYMPAEEEAEDPYNYMPEDEEAADEEVMEEAVEEESMVEEESSVEEESMMEEEESMDEADPAADDYNYEYMPSIEDDEEMEP